MTLLALSCLVPVLVNPGPVYADDTFIKLANPNILPAGIGAEVAFSHDSTYMAVSHYFSPYVTIYKRDGDTFTKLANPATLPADDGHGVAFSHDSTYLAVAHATSPYITIYKRSGDTFTKLANPASLPTGCGRDVAFSHDSSYMAVAHWTSPYITIYKRSGDTFTKLANPASLPTNDGEGVAFSHDSTYMAVAHNNSPWVTIYKRDGDTFTKLANPASLPTGIGQGVAFSHDSTYMAVAHYVSPYVTIYKRDGDTFTKLANPVSLPANAGYDVAFSHDSSYLAEAHATSPYVTIYKRDGDTFTKLANPASLPTNSGYGAAFSHDSSYLAVAHPTSPFVTIYKKVASPTLVSAATNITGTVITITFNKNMANPAGKQGEFSYKVNGGAAQSFSAAALNADNTKIDLTCAGTAIAPGNTVTISYTKGTVLAADGGVLESFTDQAVTNNMPGPPTFVSAATNITGTVITITFNKNMANPAGKQGEFSYKVNGGAAQSFSAAALNADNTKIDLTCAGTAIVPGNTVTISYTKGTVLASDGGVLESFTDQAVTNNVPPPTRQVNTATGTGIATFTTSAGGITGLTSMLPSAVPCPPRADLSFPHGLFSFNVINVTPGATVTLTITLPSPLPAGTQYLKCINGQWVDATSFLSSNDGDNVITLTITDGGPLDADGRANGTIVDPGGPAVPAGRTAMPAQPAHRVSPTLPTQLKPAQMSLQYLSVNPQQAAANQTVTITTNVVNTGDEAGNYNVALKINGQVEQTRMVSIGAQGTQPVKFAVTKAQPGSYTVDIGGQKGSFTILAAGGKAGSPVSGGLIALLVMAVLVLTTVVVLMLSFRRPA